jgi:hypothetical protein
MNKKIENQPNNVTSSAELLKRRMDRAVSYNGTADELINDDRIFRGGIDTSKMSTLDKAQLDAGIRTGAAPDRVAEYLRSVHESSTPNEAKPPQTAESHKTGSNKLGKRIIVGVAVGVIAVSLLAPKANALFHKLKQSPEAKRVEMLQDLEKQYPGYEFDDSHNVVLVDQGDTPNKIAKENITDEIGVPVQAPFGGGAGATDILKAMNPDLTDENGYIHPGQAVVVPEKVDEPTTESQD